MVAEFEYGVMSTVRHAGEAPAVVAVLMARSRGLFSYRVGEALVYLGPPLASLLPTAHNNNNNSGNLSPSSITRTVEWAVDLSADGSTSWQEAAVGCYICLLAAAREGLRPAIEQAINGLRHCCCVGADATFDETDVCVLSAWALFEAAACAQENARRSTSEHLCVQACEMLASLGCSSLVPTLALPAVESRACAEEDIVSLLALCPLVTPRNARDNFLFTTAMAYGGARRGNVEVLDDATATLSALLGGRTEELNNFLETCLYMAVANGRLDSIDVIARRAFSRFGVARRRLVGRSVGSETMAVLAAYALAESRLAQIVSHYGPQQDASHAIVSKASRALIEAINDKPWPSLHHIAA